MTALLSNRIALPVFLVVFGIFAVALPTIRMKRRTGKTGFVVDQVPTPVHRLAVEGFKVCTLALVLWVALYAALGGERLGIWTAPGVVEAAGWTAAVLGLVMIILAQAQMGLSWRIGIDAENPTALVTGGLFRWVRNPIFSGMLLGTLGVVAITPSPWTVLGWLFLLYVLALQVRLEEEHLLRLHGQTYRAYASRVGRFVPWIGRLSPGAA